MKKIRQYFFKVKEGFLDAKNETTQPAIELAYYVFICAIYLMLSLFPTILEEVFNLTLYVYIILAILTIAFFIFIIYPKAIEWASRFSTALLFKLFGRYGRVVTKEDWKNIKKADFQLYKELCTNKSRGYCYFYSRKIALFLKDAQLMYGSFKCFDGSPSGHSVIVKNNCVYDTNARIHYDIDEYKKLVEFNIYKIFSEEDYRKEDFFDNIRDGFVQWCAERNVYCYPQ